MKNRIETLLTALAAAGNAELQQLPQTQLEQYWHFTWDDNATLERNLYLFYDRLELYGSFCRRWEQLHNGSVCVVERVRDTYLMPKIRELAARLRKE